MNDQATTNTALDENSPSVIAYRVGKLEETTTKGFDGLNQKFDEFRTSFTPLEKHEKLEKRVVKLENKSDLKNTLLWVGLVASAIINIVTVAKLVGAV